MPSRQRCAICGLKSGMFSKLIEIPDQTDIFYHQALTTQPMRTLEPGLWICDSHPVFIRYIAALESGIEGLTGGPSDGMVQTYVSIVREASGLL